MTYPEGAPNSETQKPTVNYRTIFEEERARVHEAYPASNFTPGSAEEEKIHQRANERAVTEALRIILEEKGLQPSEESLRMLASGFVSSFMSLGKASIYDVKGFEMGGKEGVDVGEVIKDTFREMSSRIPDGGFDDKRHKIDITVEEGKLKIESPLPDYSK